MRFKAVISLMLVLFLSTIAYTLSPVEASADVVRVPYGYPTIQSAIDAANPGDTIVVSGGYYAEGQINVTKPLTLIAKGKVIVDGVKDWCTFKVTSSKVTIKGFVVMNASYAGIYLLSGSDGCMVEENFVTKNYHGIQADGQSNIIRKNRVLDNFDMGIILNIAGFNVVEQNIILNHPHYGISLWLAQYNTITKNVIKNNLGGGIRLKFSHNNNISHNYVTENKLVGISLYESVYNSILENLIKNNDGTGIGIGGVGYNAVKGNIIMHNARDGISITVSYENLVERNMVIGNARYGISVRTFATENTVKENIVLGNKEYDLYWDGTGKDNIWIENKYKTKSW